MNFPCECTGCDPEWCVKRASYVLERDGKRMNVCSKCKFFADKIVGRLFLESDIPSLVELDHSGCPFDLMIDVLGGMGELFQHDVKTLPYFGAN